MAKRDARGAAEQTARCHRRGRAVVSPRRSRGGGTWTACTPRRSSEAPGSGGERRSRERREERECSPHASLRRPPVTARARAEEARAEGREGARGRGEEARRGGGGGGGALGFRGGSERDENTIFGEVATRSGRSRRASGVGRRIGEVDAGGRSGCGGERKNTYQVTFYFLIFLGAEKRVKKSIPHDFTLAACPHSITAQSPPPPAPPPRTP